MVRHLKTYPKPDPNLRAEPSPKAEPESCPEISAFEPWRSGCETITCEIMDDPQEDAFLKEVKDDEAGQTMLLLCKKSTCVDVYVCVRACANSDVYFRCVLQSLLQSSFSSLLGFFAGVIPNSCSIQLRVLQGIKRVVQKRHRGEGA